MLPMDGRCRAATMRTRARKTLSALGLAASCLTTAAAHAAPAPETNAVIHVTIAPAASWTVATVTLSSVATDAASWSLRVDRPAIDAVFRDIPPGDYEIVVKVPAFHDAVSRVSVDPGTMHEFVAEMSNGDTDSAPSTLAEGSGRRGADRIFDRDILETFPGGDPVTGVIETAVAPLIAERIANGGLWTGERVVLGGNGSSWRQTSIVRDGLDVTDPLHGGAPLFTTDHASLETIVVSTSAMSSSISGAGALVSVVTRAPGDLWTGRSSIGFIPAGLQSSNARDGAPSIARFKKHEDWSGEAGGPIGVHAGVFLSARLVASERAERDEPAVLRGRVGSFSANATVAPRTQSRIRLGATVDGIRTASPARARFVFRDATQTDTFSTTHAGWDRWTNDGTALSVSGGLIRGSFSTSSPPPHTTATMERLKDGPVSALFAPASGVRQRWSARADVTPARRARSRHSPTAGVSFSRADAVLDAMPLAGVAELVGGLPARVWEYSAAGQMRWTSSDIGAYVTDRMTLPRRISLEVGGRLDGTNGAARGGSGRISWLTVTPRAYGRWAIDSRARFSLFGGYSRYAHRLPLDYLAFGDSAAPAGSVYRWNDTNEDRAFADGERGTFIGRVGACCSAHHLSGIDPDLRRPYTTEWVAGGEARLAGWSLRITGVRRNEDDLIGSINTGVQTSDYALGYVVDPGERFAESEDDRLLPVYSRLPSSFGQDSYLLTNPAGHRSRHGGVEVTVERMMASGWRTRFDGTAFGASGLGVNRGFGALEADTGAVGELFENPNARTYAWGHTFFDREYVMKWWNGYLAPRDFLLSAVARYQDGQPFSRLVIAPDLTQGPEAIPAYRRGRTRFTYTLTLDAHVQKSLRVGRSTLTAVVEAFNLLNNSKEVEENVVTGALFRATTAVQPPRAVRIAARVGF